MAHAIKSGWTARIKAHEDGEWVREAALAYAEKKKKDLVRKKFMSLAANVLT